MSPTQLAPHLLSWASILEDNTRDQAIASASMPFIKPHIALMPDAHLGKGATVGSVIPTLGAIIPAAVGVDIGCGMDAVLTQWTRDDLMLAFGGDLSYLRRSIAARVPLSAGKYNGKVTSGAEPHVAQLEVDATSARFDPEQYAGNWRLQLGSLGSGNHFIEISVDEQDRVWAFLHSGSRGVGNKIAQHHIKVASALAEKWWIDLPSPDLAYLVEGTDEFWAYIREMRWAQEFARRNREVMMQRTLDQISMLTGEETERVESISCHHNYTTKEHHFGKNVWLSRKGAIDAHEGMPGLIPGSMGAKSYVVEGLGNKASLCSAPHGAGRNHSRSAAKRMFTQESLVERMEGVEWDSESTAFVDEHPDAYKDIDVVMNDAADLVRIKHTLRQIINVKGD